MTIISVEKINGMHPLHRQHHREEVWLEGYIQVPEDLEQKAWESLGFCELIYDGSGMLADIKPTERPAPPPPEPTAQDDTDALLVDHEYRLTMLELGLNGI